MRPFPRHVAGSVVSVLGTRMSYAETTGPIDMPFERQTFVVLLSLVFRVQVVRSLPRNE